MGYARQLAIERSDAPYILFVDSDVVFYDGLWFKECVKLFKNERLKIGAIGVDTPVKLPDWRKKYVEFWWKNIPSTKKKYFHNVYFLRREAIHGIRIPAHLGAFEHVYIKSHIERNGWNTYVVHGNGIHHYDFPDWKGAWLGAGERIFGFTKIKHLPNAVVRKVLAAPLKAIPPAVAYNDPTIILQNTKYWFRYLKGWLKPNKYITLKRDI